MKLLYYGLENLDEHQELTTMTVGDHHPNGWSAVIAGGGTRGGQVIGSTNEDGTEVASGAVGVPDLFASLCFALGIDYQEENMSRSGRPIRVVNEGSVIEELFV